MPEGRFAPAEIGGCLKVLLAGTGESELRLEDEARQAKAAAEEASQKAEKGRVDVRRMKGFLQEAKEVIEKQQSQIKKLQREKAGGAVAAQGLQAEQLHAQLALVREQLASKEFELKELKVRIPPSPFAHLVLCAFSAPAEIVDSGAAAGLWLVRAVG